jgi:uncharacterized membrane protein YdbT with pleckstrin-like domain
MARAERIRLDARPHGIVLARPFGEALLLAGAGAVLVALGLPASPLGALLVAVSAVVAVRAVWRWERTRILVTDERIRVVDGTLRRREASVTLARAGTVEVEQSCLGRLLGYGTLVAGELEVPYVARPADVARLLRS